jgi:hypothetical protein
VAQRAKSPSVPKSYISSVSRSATTTHVPAEVRGPRRVELGHPAAPLSMPQRGSSMDLRLSNESRLSNIVIKGRAIRQCYTVGTQKPNGSTHVEFKSDEFANGPERLATRPGISGLGFRGMAASRCAASSSPAHSDHACLAGAANLDDVTVLSCTARTRDTSAGNRGVLLLLVISVPGRGQRRARPCRRS